MTEHGRRAMRYRGTMMALVAPLLLACGGGGDDPTGVEDVAGVYELETVSGSPLPTYWAESTPDVDVQIVSGALVLDGEGNFGSLREYRLVGPEAPTGSAFDGAEGEYAVNGARISLTFRDESGGVRLRTDATLEGDVLTITLDERVHVYRR